ncbi:MAG: hypothetical protein ACXVA2_24780 [Mucilaginibacter sp.]
MTITEKKENKTKILVNVYEPLIDIMKTKMDAACLKRDAYLDKALRCESGFLQEAPTSNSDKAKNYITDNLRQLKLKPLNLLLSTETIDLMNAVCKEKNVPRDAFINRVFLLMIANDTIIDTLFLKFIKEHVSYDIKDCHDYLSDIGWYSDADNELDALMGDRPIRVPNILDLIEGAVGVPPLWKLRSLFAWSTSDFGDLYQFPFEKNALRNLPSEYGPLRAENSLGFNVFMDDEEVSKQESDVEEFHSRAATDKLLITLMQKKPKTKPESRKKEKPAPKVKSEQTDASGESK